MQDENWEQLNRKLVYDSKFMKVYEDTVKLPNGKIIDDYTLVEKPNIVMIVATTTNNELISLEEYKYAVNQTLRTLPAGHVKANETPVDAAKRELLEETGYSGESFEEIGILRDYPSKDVHKVYVVRVKNVDKIKSEVHEDTEIITYELLDINQIKKQINNGEWIASSALASITFSGILF